MPKGVYVRSPECLAGLKERMRRIYRRTDHLHTPEMKAKRDAAVRLARPPKKYARSGTGTNCHWIHRTRAETALGKTLPVGACVHHADGSKNPNAPLVICQDNAYHMALHQRMRVQAHGGDPWLDKICSSCKAVKPKTEFCRDRSSPEGLSMKCRRCHADKRIAYKARRAS